MVKTSNHPQVFVYGTLKKSHGLNGLLRRHDAEFIGYDYVREPCEMLTFGAYPGVHMLEEGHGYESVYGELWRVTDEGLAALDMAEGHPHFFKRVKLRTDYRKERAWMYTVPQPIAELAHDVVETGIWYPSEEEIQFWTTEAAVQA